MHPLFHTLKMSDPVATVLADGSVLYAGLAFRDAETTPAGSAFASQDLFVARSTDGGMTFPDVRIMEPGPGFASFDATGYTGLLAADKPWLAVGPGAAVLLVWTFHDAAHMSDMGAPAATHGELRWSATLDGGKTWSAPATIAGGPGMRWGAMPVIGSDGTWYVSYNEVQNAEGFALVPFIVAISRDQGKTWEPRTVDLVVDQFPQLAIAHGGHRDLLVAAYSSDEGGKRNPVITWSEDEGRTWSPRLRLEPSANAPLPVASLAAGLGGLTYVSFWNQVQDGSLERRIVAVNGTRIAANTTLDSGVIEYGGEYQGQVALPSGALAVWSREDASGRSDLFSSKYEWR